MSRRFKSRHAKVVAKPDAEPVPPVVLDDSNSTVDVLQPDRRIPNELNTRFVAKATAGSDEGDPEPDSAEAA